MERCVCIDCIHSDHEYTVTAETHCIWPKTEHAALKLRSWLADGSWFLFQSDKNSSPSRRVIGVRMRSSPKEEIQ